MNIRPQIRNIIIEVICMLFVLLFVYAATSKLLDFQHFKIEIGQSPLLSAFAEWVAVLVPAAEYLTCLLIIIPRFRLTGLFLAYGLMVMFTFYIYIILNHTSFVPCSCGGVLEKLDWKSHMIFNLVFVLLGILGVLLYNGNPELKIHIMNRRKIYAMFTLITICSICIVSGLFMLSENIIHYHNRLTRRFPHSPIQQVAVKNLNLNSFYIAGADSTNIYLGNITSPLVVVTLNKNLIQIRRKMIDLNEKNLPFKGVKVTVQAPYFFVADGTVPCIFRGKIDTWNAFLVYQKGEYFTTTLAIDSSRVAVRTNSSFNGDNILGVIKLGPTNKTILNPEILQKQFDGVFDTDGMLLYSKEMKKIIYIYAYRNQYIITDRDLKISWRGNTIDTISKAKLSIENDKKNNQREFSKPPLFVNKHSAVYQNLLFVHSAIPGRYEDSRMWKRASIIDVYDLIDKSYLLSFCIYDMDGKKMKSFAVENDQLYVLIGTKIIKYKIDKRITEKYTKQDTKKLLAK